MIFYIDVINSCNCRCVDCYRSIYRTKRSEYEVMSPELLQRILSKASKEVKENLTIGLYNWSEPFLHSRIGELVGIVAKNDMRSVISSNFSLNINKQIESVFENGLNNLIVSVSGFSQKTYGKYHVGGNIELVKRNLRFIAEIEKQNRNNCTSVHYIDFEYNQEEKILFKRFCDEINIKFISKENTFTDFLLDDGDLSSNFNTLNPYSNHDCPLLRDMLPIDQRGDVYLCCGTWYHPSYRIGQYLDIPLQRLQYLRTLHPRCSLCK